MKLQELFSKYIQDSNNMLSAINSLIKDLQLKGRILSSSIKDNFTEIKKLLGDGDIVSGKLAIVGGGWAGIIYIDGLAHKDAVKDYILKPLLTGGDPLERMKRRPRKFKLEDIRMRLLTTADLREAILLEEVIGALLIGDTALFLDGSTKALVIDTKGFPQRGLDKPETEVTVRGSKESFTEYLKTNFTLLRRQLHTSDLRFESFTIGRLSRTEVRLTWIEGVTNPRLIQEARHRIQRIDVDYVFGTSMIAELIEDDPRTLWPQIAITERPDVLASNLVEGRFAVFVDGTPFALIAPALFWDRIQTVDDYSERPIIGSFFRLIRQIAFYVSILSSPIYVAVVTFHHSIIPPVLALRLAAGREGVPFPTLVETLLLTASLDLLREAGVRLPKAVGSAIGILGAVVIGQAAVSAGFVSPALIIIVSLSAIATFSIPDVTLSNATRIIGYFLILLGGTLGIFGVILGMVFMLRQVLSLRSFGIPIFYPLAPRELYGLKDLFIRAPYWQLRRRPSLLAADNPIRLGNNDLEPKPPKDRTKATR